MFTESAKLRIGKIYAAVAIPSIILAIVGFGYAFCTGVVEAGWAPRWVPTGFIGAYCWPVHAVEEIPIVGNWMRLANDMGYQFADGPETTR